MSWDIFVQDIPAGAKSVADIPDDFEPREIGLRSEIIAKIQRAFPEADFTDPAWGRLDGPGYSLELNLGEEERLSGFAIHSRGGELDAHAIAEILSAVRLRAFDPQNESGIFNPASARESQARWEEYRRRWTRA